MAIPSNGFEVIFTQKRGEQDFVIQVDSFFTSEAEFYEKRNEVYTEIKENIGASITFRSKRADARLFMDGLDTLPERLLKVDPVEGVYLSPSEFPVTLYDHTKEYYPLIPGFYRLSVEDGGQRYFSWVKVIPKQLDETQWETMREEVERELSGLARDVILRKYGLNAGTDGIPHGLLEKFVVINNGFSSIMSALSDLYRKVNFQIKKDYRLVPTEKSRLIDEKTIRHRVSHPEKEHVLKTPISAITYDLPENRLAKKIIQSISQTLTDFMNSVESFENSIHHGTGVSSFRTKAEAGKALSELEKLGEAARKIRGAIQWIKTAPWYQEVGDYQATVLPHVMNSDPRYRALYQLYRQLENKEQQPERDASYSYQWKRSDKLYEIWGYLQFIKTLLVEGFTPVKGWVFSTDPTGNSLLHPTLPANTNVLFQKGSLRLQLIYEALLPTQSKLTTKQNPLYTRGTHTCPDGRLDVYLVDIFIGTIVFDFKYRPKSAIWDQNLIQCNQQTAVMRQLVSYGDNLHSPFLYGEGDSPLGINISPVQEVWAIYPNRYGLKRVHEFPDHKLSLIELTPGLKNEEFARKINNGVERMVERSGAIMKLFEKIKS